MLEKGKKYKFEIIDIGINFEGIAKTEEGLTVFIPGALKGESVIGKIEKVNKSYALANIQEIANKSEHRCEAECTCYKKCGGCDAMHTTYEDTLEIKKQNVINTLKKQGIDENIVKDIYGMGNPYYYRNKVQYPVRNINGKNYMGMFSKGTHEIIQNDECLIQDKLTHEIAKRFYELLKDNFKGYNEKDLTGDIRNIMVRRGTHTKEIMCVLVVQDENIQYNKYLNQLVECITKEYSDISSIVLNINNKNTNVILSNKNICIYGKEYITDIIGDYTFKITADSFFQVNTLQAEVLYNLLKEGLKLEKEKTLLELYSGVGTIGIFLSDAVKDIYAVEIVESAVLAAKENANLNNVKNIIHVNGDATEETLKLKKQGKTFDYIVVDPPRKGLDNQGVELILELEPEKIGYVSCNPATLARDLKILEEKYIIKEINLVDMFPWTSHVETVAVLNIKK